MVPAKIKIEDYNYGLPDERIAKYPLPERDKSKLLVLKNSHISEHTFFEIPQLIPRDSLLLFNETKVIQARLLFRKESGAKIEIFCLEPVLPVNDFQLALEQKPPVVWKCMVGNARRWKSGELNSLININGKEVMLTALLKERLSDSFLVEFLWQPQEVTFSEILDTSGLTPLPPYLHRDAEETDKIRYQTVYARYEGSVAAPTAGLHFTAKVMNNLAKRDIATAKLVLHVGAGTFKPVSSQTIEQHQMHTEKIKVDLSALEKISAYTGKNIIPVGTTSMRNLETLFWIGLKLHYGYTPFNKVEQWDAYKLKIPDGFTPEKSLETIINYLYKNNLKHIEGETQMIIVPGYKFRFANGLITNFHQPKSTLLLLVSALIGENWKKVYDFALNNDFRFLSYGDSCLLLP